MVAGACSVTLLSAWKPEGTRTGCLPGKRRSLSGRSVLELRPSSDPWQDLDGEQRAGLLLFPREESRLPGLRNVPRENPSSVGAGPVAAGL